MKGLSWNAKRRFYKKIPYLTNLNLSIMWAGIAAIITALIGGVASIATNNSQNRANQQMVRQQNRTNQQLWHQETAYNHPVRQMNRLRSAGLNPNLMYGQSVSGATGQMSSAPKAERANMEYTNPLIGANAAASFAKMTAETDNLRAQNDVLLQEAALRQWQAANEEQRAAVSRVDAQYAQKLKESSLQMQQSTMRNLEARTINTALDTEIRSEAKRDIVRELYYRAQNAAEELKGKRLNNERTKLDNELRRIGIDRNDPWYFRIMGRILNQQEGFQDFMQNPSINNQSR